MSDTEVEPNTSSTTLHLGARVRHTTAEGPGQRYAIWVSGCSIRCPGCCNPHLFDAEAGDRVAVDDVLADIGATDDVEGVTLLGGEPFDQASALAELAAVVRELGLSVMVFSGYRLEALRRRGEGEQALLGEIDLLVDGPYMEALHQTDRRWIGSSNQRIHFLTDRYDHLRDNWDEGANTVELRLVDGKVHINGFPAPGLERIGEGGE